MPIDSDHGIYRLGTVLAGFPEASGRISQKGWGRAADDVTGAMAGVEFMVMALAAALWRPGGP